MNKKTDKDSKELTVAKRICIAVMILCLLSSVALCLVIIEVEHIKWSQEYKIPISYLTSTADEVATTVSATEDEPAKPQFKSTDITINIGKPYVIELSKDETSKLTQFESSDNSIVVVDDGGRIDALKEGNATVTAYFDDESVYTYKIKINPAISSAYDGYSTCILANTDIENENRRLLKQNLYSIEVNRKMNCVTVYTYDNDGKYTIPVRAMICSSGLNNGTITGSYDMYFKSDWLLLNGGVYGQYISGISGDYLFHTVPYTQPAPDTLETDEFNKLGDFASLGCIRMSVADTKWVYDNCSVGTRVRIFDDDNPGPLGKPEPIRISNTECGWDPTDSNESNPYNDRKPYISGADDITIAKNSSFNPLDNVKAFDTCTNDISSKIEVVGNVITSRAGEYKVTYSVTDAMHRSAETTITVTVE